MKAIFRVNWNTETNTPDIPPFESEDGGIQLYYTEDDELKGGYSLIGLPGDGKINVMINASEETIEAMKADDKYTWMEDVNESEE